MKKAEFLAGLREALAGSLAGHVVEGQISFYDQYITEQTSAGKREEEVVQMLGDPWVLAQTIIAAEERTKEGAHEAQVEYSSDMQYGRRAEYGKPKDGSGKVRVFGFDTWWKKLLLILSVVMVLVLVVSIITGLISFFLPILIPLFLITFIIKLIKHRNS